MIKLKDLMKEATLATSLGGAKRRKGYVSPKTVGYKSTKTTAKSTLDKHTSDEPTKTTTDTTSWTHPYSKATVKLGKGEKLPSHT